MPEETCPTPQSKKKKPLKEDKGLPIVPVTVPMPKVKPPKEETKTKNKEPAEKS